MTDRQQIQQIVFDYFKRKTAGEIVAKVESLLSDCMICTDHGHRLCELHADNERTEVERQRAQ